MRPIWEQQLDSAEAAMRLVALARRSAGQALAARPVLAVLERARAQLRTEASWRQRIETQLSDFVGHLQPTLPMGRLLELLDPQAWEAKLSLEWPGAEGQGGAGLRVETLPLGVMLHICPGNGLETALWSLCHGLLAGNQNIVKLSRRVPAVAATVVELLVACGLPVSQVQFVAWPHERQEITRALLGGCDGAVVWGDEETIAVYRRELHPGTRFLAYGPRLSLGVLTARSRHDGRVVDNLVADVCHGEQQSCSAVQCLLVEVAPGEDLSVVRARVLEQLRESFHRYCAQNPPPSKSPDAQMEMWKRLETARWDAHCGRGALASGYPDWLAVWQDDRRIGPSCLFRTLLIHPYRSSEHLRAQLSPVRSYLQTISLGCVPEERDEYLALLWQAGATRVVAAGGCSAGRRGAPHEGARLLPQFLRLVSYES
jgi:phenylacetate-CoA ligase